MRRDCVAVPTGNSRTGDGPFSVAGKNVSEAAFCSATRELAFQAVSEHFDLFASRLPERSVGQLFYNGSAFCDAKHRAVVERAFDSRAEKTLGGKRELAQTLEVVDLCIANRAVQMPSVSSYLQRPGK
jgi:alanyl aminopeptidase